MTVQTVLMPYVAPKTNRIPNVVRATWKCIDSATRYEIENGTAIRANAARARLALKSAQRLAANRKSFPLYRNGRMLVCHPEYQGTVTFKSSLGTSTFNENEISIVEEAIRDSRND